MSIARIYVHVLLYCGINRCHSAEPERHVQRVVASNDDTARQVEKTNGWNLPRISVRKLIWYTMTMHNILACTLHEFSNISRAPCKLKFRLGFENTAGLVLNLAFGLASFWYAPDLKVLMNEQMRLAIAYLHKCYIFASLDVKVPSRQKMWYFTCAGFIN